MVIMNPPLKGLKDSSYNLSNNSDCLHFCEVNTANFFIFLLQFNTLHTSHSNINILCNSHSNTQNPVHYFGIIHFILPTQTCTVLCITSCTYPRPKTKTWTFSQIDRANWKQHLQFNCVHQNYTNAAAKSAMCFYTLGIFPRNMAYIQHLAISLTLLQDCLDPLFAEVLPRQCPPSPSNWYCCLWGVMDLVWLSSVHACFLNSITNLSAMSVSFQRPHAQKSYNREISWLALLSCAATYRNHRSQQTKVNWHQWSIFR
jgi:hypothetical protein